MWVMGWCDFWGFGVLAVLKIGIYEYQDELEFA